MDTITQSMMSGLQMGMQALQAKRQQEQLMMQQQMQNAQLEQMGLQRQLLGEDLLGKQQSRMRMADDLRKQGELTQMFQPSPVTMPGLPEKNLLEGMDATPEQVQRFGIQSAVPKRTAEGNPILNSVLSRKANPELFKALISKGLLGEALKLPDIEKPTHVTTPPGGVTSILDAQGNVTKTIAGPEKEETSLDQLLAREVRAGRMTLPQALEAKREKTNELKLGNSMEAAMAALVPNYLTDPQARTTANAQYSSDTAFRAKVLAEAKRVTEATSAPYNTVIQTGEGFVPFNARSGQLGQPTNYGKALPANEAQEMGDLKTTYDRLTAVGEKAEALKARFGPIEGRWQKLKVQFVKDGPTQELVNELSSLITIAYSLSGKQISVQELKMLQSAMLPRLEQPEENFRATLKFAKSWVANTHNNRLDYYKQNGYSGKTIPIGSEQKTETIERKTVGGKSYFKKAGKWFEE